MSRYFTSALAALEPYTPGEQPQDRRYIKLNTNESPYPAGPQVVKAVNADAVRDLRLYSDPACTGLVNAIAARCGVKPTQVMPGNGSDEVLSFAVRAFCDERTPLAYADITYGFYGVWAKLWGVPDKVIPLREDFTLNVEDYLGLGATVVIANPNAPTGLALKPVQIERLLQADPDHVVIVDEAYVDFGAESCVPLVEKYAEPAGGADLLQVPQSGRGAAGLCHRQRGADRRPEPGEVQLQPLQHQPAHPAGRYGRHGG